MEEPSELEPPRGGGRIPGGTSPTFFHMFIFVSKRNTITCPSLIFEATCLIGLTDCGAVLDSDFCPKRYLQFVYVGWSRNYVWGCSADRVITVSKVTIYKAAQISLTMADLNLPCF